MLFSHWELQSITVFMAFSDGWKSGYKNRDLAIKSVIGCIISIFEAKKSGHKNRGYKNRDDCIIG